MKARVEASAGLRNILVTAIGLLLITSMVWGQQAPAAAQMASAPATDTQSTPGMGAAPAGQGGTAAGSWSSKAGQGQMCPPQCGQMMEKEMRAYPWKLVGVTTIGLLAGISLVLLIALEVQWLKLWAHRVRIERANVASPPAAS